jgi:copper chaperone CopZ
MATKRISIEGMSCGHCINRVRESLLSLPGVDGVTVSIADKLAVVECDEGAVTDEELIEAVERFSFEVTGVR